MTFGSRQPYANAKQRNEQTMATNLTKSDDYPDVGPTSIAWFHKKLATIQRGNDQNVARSFRNQEDQLTSRLNEEKQLSDITTGRRPGLRGEGGRVRAAQYAAQQVYDGK